jgi:cytoskeletal protein CcmA (bactofilin family)
MWKKEDAKPQGVAETSSSVAPALSSHRDSPAFSPASSQPPVSAKATACISQGIKIKGEITGSEDLFVDGPIEGKVNLANGSLTVGPNGTVKADVVAREVVVRGRVEGKIAGKERVQLWSTGQVSGEIQTQRLAIEDGAVLRGKVETGRATEKNEERSVSAGKPNGATVSAGTTI